MRSGVSPCASPRHVKTPYAFPVLPSYRNCKEMYLIDVLIVSFRFQTAVECSNYNRYGVRHFMRRRLSPEDSVKKSEMPS